MCVFMYYISIYVYVNSYIIMASRYSHGVIYTHAHMRAHKKMCLQSLPEAPAGDIKWKWHLKLQRSLAKKLSIPGKQGEKNKAIEA